MMKVICDLMVIKKEMHEIALFSGSYFRRLNFPNPQFGINSTAGSTERRLLCHTGGELASVHTFALECFCFNH